MKSPIPTLLLSLCTLAVLPASANQITIDFEHTPGADGILGTADDVPVPATFIQPLGDSFASVGLRFTQGSLLQASFFNGDAANHFISSTNPIAVLTTPVTGISIDSYSYWDAVLTAYDVNGNAIASDRLVNPQAGRSFLRGALSVAGTQAIYGFSVLPDNPDYILNLDNLVLTSAASTTDVPEPTGASLFALGLFLTAFSQKGRKSSGSR
jgi:hypothetical protein